MKGQLSSISDKLGSLTSENGFHVEDTEPTVNGLDITPACIIGFAIRRMLDDEVRLPSSHAQSVITSPTEGFRTQLTLTAPQPVKSETAS